MCVSHTAAAQGHHDCVLYTGQSDTLFVTHIPGTCVTHTDTHTHTCTQYIGMQHSTLSFLCPDAKNNGCMVLTRPVHVCVSHTPPVQASTTLLLYFHLTWIPNLNEWINHIRSGLFAMVWYASVSVGHTYTHTHSCYV